MKEEKTNDLQAATMRNTPAENYSSVPASSRPANDATPISKGLQAHQGAVTTLVVRVSPLGRGVFTSGIGSMGTVDWRLGDVGARGGSSLGRPVSHGVLETVGPFAS
jgi:hypothetical protein